MQARSVRSRLLENICKKQQKEGALHYPDASAPPRKAVGRVVILRLTPVLENEILRALRSLTYLQRPSPSYHVRDVSTETFAA
jgi:hypothetical protein